MSYALTRTSMALDGFTLEAVKELSERWNISKAEVMRRAVRQLKEQSEKASRLFHYTGLRRGSHADCMIAAAALCNRRRVATRNIDDFDRFVPYGLSLERVPTI